MAVVLSLGDAVDLEHLPAHPVVPENAHELNRDVVLDVFHQLVIHVRCADHQLQVFGELLLYFVLEDSLDDLLFVGEDVEAESLALRVLNKVPHVPVKEGVAREHHGLDDSERVDELDDLSGVERDLEPEEKHFDRLDFVQQR